MAGAVRNGGSTGTGDGLERGKYFVSELCGEFHGERVDRHLP